MATNNAINANNTDFAITSGSFGLAPRVRLTPGVENLSIAYSGSVLSITGGDGTALSATNPGYVTLQSNGTPGKLVTITVTADQGFIDDTGASEIIGNRFGLTTGIAWTQDIPFFVYAVSNDAENAVAFVICRCPQVSNSCALAILGAPDDAVANTQGSMFSFENLDETLYDTNPCLMIGSFRMRMSAADDWTVQALLSQDGIGRYQEDKEMYMQTGQMGASANTFLLPNGGTAPIFTENLYTYWVEAASGYVFCQVDITGDGGTDGAGAVSALLALPYVPSLVTNESPACGSLILLDPVNGATLGTLQIGALLGYGFLLGEAQNVIQNADYSAGNRAIQGSFRYRINFA